MNDSNPAQADAGRFLAGTGRYSFLSASPMPTLKDSKGGYQVPDS
jgi:hypothetical protein